jgi:hypothetical protein
MFAGAEENIVNNSQSYGTLTTGIAFIRAQMKVLRAWTRVDVDIATASSEDPEA